MDFLADDADPSQQPFVNKLYQIRFYLGISFFAVILSRPISHCIQTILKQHIEGFLQTPVF